MPIIRVPTVKLTPGKDSYAKLLLHMDGADNGTTFTDECGKTVTRYGAVTKTGVKKFGTASAYFDGAGDYLSIAASDDFNFGAGDFTIDFWVKTAISNKYQYILGQTNNAVNAEISFTIRFNTDGTISGIISYDGTTITSIITSVNSYADDVWHHIALVRNSTTVKLYVDGVSVAGALNIGTNSLYNSSEVLGIGTAGALINPVYMFNGYIDELRISKGIARWTSNFTPPVCAYY